MAPTPKHFQYVFNLPLALVTDTHVATAMIALGFTLLTNPDKICQEISQWIPREMWNLVNKRFGGLNQIWVEANLERQSKILELAHQHGILEEFKTVLKVDKNSVNVLKCILLA